MAPKCKIIKYKPPRWKTPVVSIKRCPPPPTRASTTSSATSNDLPPFFHYGEGDVEEEFVPQKVRPHRSTLERLRDWMKKQRFIPQDLSDDFLGLFLSAAAYSVDAAARQLEKYFFSRQEPSPIFRDRDPLSPENVRIFNTLYVLPMPDTTEDGKKIILTGLVNPTGVYNQVEHAKALAMVLDLLIWERDFGFGDFVVVLDGRGFSCPQLLENRVRDRGSIKSLIQDTVPGTLRSFYLLYPPPHVAKVADTRDGIWINVVKSLREMASRLPADILPLEYGGNLGHLGDLLEQWELHMVENREFFVHFEKRMMRDYQRRLCHQKEVLERRRNWVQEMKLVAEEWEYKIRYYEKMKTMTPLKHPAFGSQRSFFKPKPKPAKDPFGECRKKAKKELEDSKVFEPPKLYNGYAKEIREAQKAAQQQQQQQQQQQEFVPILELEIHCG